DLRLLVELAADAVAAELAHDREPGFLGARLDGGADIAQARTRANAADAFPHALVGDVDEAACLDARLADVKHAAAVAVVAVLDHRDIDVQDVARLEDAIAGHAVTDLMVHR